MVAHGKMLRVVPVRRYRVAIVVAHRQASSRRDTCFFSGNTRPIGAADGFWKEIHLAVVIGQLLRLIVVILIGGHRLVAPQAKRIRLSQSVLFVEKVRILGQQLPAESFDPGSSGECRELWIARRIQRIRIRREVVVEGDILLKDNHDMPNRILRLHCFSPIDWPAPQKPHQNSRYTPMQQLHRSSSEPPSRTPAFRRFRR